MYRVNRSTFMYSSGDVGGRRSTAVTLRFGRGIVGVEHPTSEGT